MCDAAGEWTNSFNVSVAFSRIIPSNQLRIWKSTNNIFSWRVFINKSRIKEILINESMRFRESYAQLQQTIKYFFTLPETDEVIVKWTLLKAVFHH
jgi:hypothetical protein